MQFNNKLKKKFQDFLKGNNRTVQAKKQVLYSFVIKGISILIGLIFVPLILNYLDAERYGIWLTLSSIIMWFSFFDVGLGNGLRNKFTESLAKGEHDKAQVFVSTTYAIITIVFITVLLLFYIINPFLNWTKILNTNMIPSEELTKLALIVFTFFILRFIFKLIGVIVTADQRSHISNSFGPIGNIFSLILLIILINTTKGSLILLGLLLSASPVLVLIIASFFLFRNDYYRYRPTIHKIDFKYAPELLNFGIKFFLIQLTAIILFSTSNFIITQISGPSTVTQYNISYKYFRLPFMIYIIILSPVWSAVTDAYTKKDFKWLKSTLRKLNIISYAFVAISVLLLLFSDFFYLLWLGDKITIPFSLSLTNMLLVIITVVVAPYSQFLNGMGKIKVGLIVIIFKMTFFIPLAFLLGNTQLGAAGVVLAIIIIQAVSLFLEPYQVTLLLNKKAKGIWNE